MARNYDRYCQRSLYVLVAITQGSTFPFVEKVSADRGAKAQLCPLLVSKHHHTLA